LKGALQQLVATGLFERHFARFDSGQLAFILVVNPDPTSDVGKAEGERETNMAGAADDHEVEVGH
jgi:hypothetical protein